MTLIAAGRDGLVRAEDVAQALASDTILISIMHANNETGAIQPVREIADLARQADVAFHTDAVQTCGKIPLDVNELNCEFLTLSAHKINGPKGVGALFCRGRTPWQPLITGGDQEQHRRTGTEGVHQIVGLGAAARLAQSRMSEEFGRLGELRGELVAGLQTIFPDIVINEAPADRQLPGTINATFPGKEGIRILAGLDCYEVSVSIGSACTADRIEPSHVLLGMGLGQDAALQTIRMSMGTTTVRADVRYVIEVFREILKRDPAGFGFLDPKHLTEDRIRSETTFMIDLRFPYERMLSASVPGAKEWSHIYFQRFMKHIPPDKEVIIMCGTGIFSVMAGYHLANSGHRNVKVVYGGYAAWRGLYPGLLSRLLEGSRAKGPDNARAPGPTPHEP